MELTPGNYKCASHDVDLTELVREELAERVVIAYKPRRSGEFKVIVTCPGLGSGGAHQLGFSGHVTYGDG